MTIARLSQETIDNARRDLRKRSITTCVSNEAEQRRLIHELDALDGLTGREAVKFAAMWSADADDE
jgi:hypothetical protein